MARVLLVEDDRPLARGLQKLLEMEGFAVDIAENAEDGLEIAKHEPYHLMILDVGLPGMSGFDAVQQVRRDGNNIPVLMLTARHDRFDRIQGLDFGADDYLGKPFDEQELLAHVRALVRRSMGSASPIITVGKLSCNVSDYTASIGDEQLDLRRREWSVLYALVTRAGKVVSKERLISEVFGYDDPVGTNAVEVYIARLRKKLGTSGPQIRSLRGIGYMMDAE